MQKLGVAPLRSYVPRAFWSARITSGTPYVRAAQGAVLMIDLCDFSATTQSLVAAGPEGAESLHAALETFFESTIAAIELHGGDVLGFAGDAAIAAWDSCDVESGLCVAMACGWHLLREPGGASLYDGRRLEARVAIGVGSITYCIVGGHHGRFIPVMLGGAVVEAMRADGLHQRGCLVLARHGVEPKVVDYDMDHAAYAPGTLPPRAPATLPTIPDDFAMQLAPEIVQGRSPLNARAFSTEFRQSSVVFLSVDPRLEAAPESLHAVTFEIQRLCEAHEAWLYQISRDDKGLTYVVNLGAPTFAHENDAERALVIASESRDALAKAGVLCKAGVASGPVLYGEYGTETRRHYALLGSCMNRAARLAGAADWGQRLCDAATHSLAARGLQLLGSNSRLSLRGLGSTATFELMNHRTAPDPRAVPEPVRAVVINQLLRMAQHPDGPGHARIIVLEADAGAGKSTVLRGLFESALSNGLKAVSTAGQRLHARSTFHSARPFLEWVLNQISEAQRVLVARLLARIDAPAEELAESPGGLASLADRLGRLLGRWLDAIQSLPVLFLLDELQWADSASWRLLVRMAEKARLLTVVGARRADGAPPSELDFSMAGPVERIRLEPLDNTAMRRVLCDQLDSHEVAGELLTFVAERAQGNPLFAVELTRSLSTQAAIRIHDYRGHRTARLSRVVVQAALPPTLEGLIISRFDRLDGSTREVGKVAAVLGERFELDLLESVLKAMASDEPADFALSLLAQSGWLEADGRQIRFKHALYPEVIAGLSPPSERRALHRRAAYCLELLASPEGLGRLAYHWSAAGESARALPLLEQAALRALRSQAYREAIELYREALTIRERVMVQAPLAARARTERLLGRALMGLTRHGEANLMLRQAGRTAGHRRPDSLRGFALELVEYVWHRLRRGIGIRARNPQLDIVHEAANAAADRAAVVLWLGQPLRYAQLSLAVANLGERSLPCKETAWGISSVAYLLAMTPARRLAPREFERALTVARAAGDAEMVSSCLVLYGMALTGTGRPRESIPLLERACEVSEPLRDSFWRHRARFMLAEALLEAGEHLSAAQAFDEAAAMALEAEPGIYGFTRALAAVAWARLGDETAARERIEGPFGVDDARAHGAVLPLFAALGAEAQVRCQSERTSSKRIAEVADEIETLLSAWQATMAYYAGVHGHTGRIEARLRALECGEENARAAKQAIVHLAKFCATYPGGRARLEIARARWHRATGQMRQALRKLALAERLARTSGQDFELARCRDLRAQWLGGTDSTPSTQTRERTPT